MQLFLVQHLPPSAAIVACPLLPLDALSMQTWQACVDGVMDGPDGVADDETRKVAVEKCAGVVR